MFLLLLAFATAPAAESPPREKWEWTATDCPTGTHRQPDGPFAVILFCEDALGSYLSVLHLDPIGAPFVDRWSLNDRYWHEPVWGSDVTGFKWDKDRKRLFVSTQGIYGAGGFFELDLQARKAKQVKPKGKPVSIEAPGPGYNISGAVLKEPKQ